MKKTTVKGNTLRNRYLQTLGIVTIVLALVRCAFPRVAGDLADRQGDGDTAAVSVADTMAAVVPGRLQSASVVTPPTRYVKDGERHHRILSVSSYQKAFPDSNHVQIEAARQWGVTPVKNRADAELRKNELVYIGSSPYYSVAHLDASIPYLVPRAALLLHDIGVNFFDSLQVKGVPVHRLLVTSVLRTEDDVTRLRRSNQNATEQSCHLYGTTFDINYNLYSVIADPDRPPRADVSDVRLKQVLSEVLNDLRQQGRCYIKYESRQPCFHITVR